MGRALPVAAVALLALAAILGSWSPLAGGGLTIVTTFPFIYEDLARLACPGDVVVSLAPPGSDPHEYQLKPTDMELLREADVIVSLAHAPFEVEIRRLYESGNIKALLVEVPSVPNMTILTHPRTRHPNYHGVLFHSRNYAAFINYMAGLLEFLRPGCRAVYWDKARALISELENLESSLQRLRGVAIIDTPVVQYAVEWLGLEVHYVLVIEEGLPILPRDYEGAKEIASATDEVVIAAVQGSAAEAWLRELARYYGRPFLLLPNPLAYNGTLNYMRAVAAAAVGRGAEEAAGAGAGRVGVAALALALLALLIVSLMLRGRVSRG